MIAINFLATGFIESLIPIHHRYLSRLELRTLGYSTHAVTYLIRPLVVAAPPRGQSGTEEGREV